MRRTLLSGLIGGLALCGFTAAAYAHSERHFDNFGPKPGSVPDINRVNSTRVVVCKPSSEPTQAQLDDIHQRLAQANDTEKPAIEAEEAAWQRNHELFPECQFAHIQDAANAVSDNTDILVMPGVYLEEPSRAAPTTGHGDNADGTYSYEYHVAHPNDANLVFISRKNVTLEGTGATPRDVVVDAGFVKDVGIRCDRCDGFIVRNIWEKDANEHGIYVVDSDGYIFDHDVGSFNKAYELFSFASDHGLYTDCEAIGGGDSGIYIGGDPTTPGRYAAELRNSVMHHNALGFSGTQGSSIWMHDNEAYDNAIGISFDSENDHPNFPQSSSVIENNDLHDNNFDVYAQTSDVPLKGPGYDFFRYPVGTGLWIVGGVNNIIRNNRIYSNIRIGAVLAGNPLESPLPALVNGNQYYDNVMGVDAGNGAEANGTAYPPGQAYPPGGGDFFWDQTGDDNCWGPNGTAKTDPNPAPGPCPMDNTGKTAPEGDQLDLLLSCLIVPVSGTNPTQYVTADTSYPCPWGHDNQAPYESSAQAECENGHIDLGELCDPGAEDEGGPSPNLNDQTCASLGAGDGTLACTNGCTWDFSGCTGPRLTATITPSDASIPLTDASSLPASGKVKINSELVRYSGKNGNSLAVSERGADGTIKASHANGVPAALQQEATTSGPSDCAIGHGKPSAWTLLLLLPPLVLWQRRRVLPSPSGPAGEARRVRVRAIRSIRIH